MSNLRRLSVFGRDQIKRLINQLISLGYKWNPLLDVDQFIEDLSNSGKVEHIVVNIRTKDIYGDLRGNPESFYTEASIKELREIS